MAPVDPLGAVASGGLLAAPLPLGQPDDAWRQAPQLRARVLHVINGEHYAGAERVQDLLAQRLPEFGVEIGFACLKADRFPHLRRAIDTPLYDLSMRHRLDLSVSKRLAEILRRDGYQLAHTHTPRSALIGALASARAGIPLVHHVHSPASKDSTRRWQNRFNSWVERISLRRASRLIAVSQSLAGHMRAAGFDEQIITVAPNGVPVRAAPLRPAPGDSWMLGTVALLRPRKGMEVLLESLAILRSRTLPVRLRVVGPFETEPYERELKSRCERLGLREAVDWTGFARDVNSELAKIDLFVLPSLFGEGMPMVVLEAMAAGVPVVASRVEGVPEAIRDRLDGVLVQPGDAEDLSRAIAELVRGRLDWLTLRDNALRRQAECFSDRSMAARVAQIYLDMLSS